MSQYEGQDIWGRFEDAVAQAKSSLGSARQNYETVRQLNEPLASSYGVALDELSETVGDLDSAYDVDKETLSTATTAAERATLLAEVTAAYQDFYTQLIKARVEIFCAWFDALEITVEGGEWPSDGGMEALAKRVTAARKLVEAGKYAQLQSSDRVDLDEIELKLESLDGELQSELPPEQYVQAQLELVNGLKERYTDQLSAMGQMGADMSLVSVSDRVRAAPDIDALEETLSEAAAAGEQPDGELVERAAEARTEYADIARSTDRRRAEFDLGRALVAAVLSAGIADEDVEAELQSLADRFAIDALRSQMAELIDDEATTSDTERVQRLLREHDGSVRRTFEAAEMDAEALFLLLSELFTTDELVELEARFE